MALRLHGMEEVGVRFSLGPQKIIKIKLIINYVFKNKN